MEVTSGVKVLKGQMDEGKPRSDEHSTVCLLGNVVDSWQDLVGVINGKYQGKTRSHKQTQLP